MVLFSERGVDLASKLSRLSIEAKGGARFHLSAKLEDEVVILEKGGHGAPAGLQWAVAARRLARAAVDDGSRGCVNVLEVA